MRFVDCELIGWRGRLTLEDGVETLRARIRHLLVQRRKHIVLDLKKLTEIDSSGLAELVATCATVAEGGGELKLAGVPKRVERLLRMTRLNRLFENPGAARDRSGPGFLFQRAA